MKTLDASKLAKKTRILILCVCFSAAWSAFAILLILLFPGFFNNFSSRMYDWKLSISHVGTFAPEIVHLDIDDQAVKEFGPWPWDRALSARIVERLTEFGAKLVVFDIFYASPGKSKEGNLAFFEAIKSAGNVISATGIAELTDSEEKKLKLDQDRTQANAIYDASWPLRVPREFRLLRTVDLRSSVLPLLPIIQFSKGVGHIAGTPDPDGIYRKIALVVKLEDRCIPSLSLSALMAYWNLSPDSITFGDGNEIKIGRGNGPVVIPVDSQGMMPVNWGQAWTSFKHYSAKDILGDAPDPSRPSRYKDKIVFVAVTATGNTDICTTPLSISAPLNRIHSQTINTILTKSFIRRVPVFPWIAILLASLAIAFPLAAAGLSLKWEAISAVLICMCALSVDILCFVLWRYDLPLAGGLVIFFPAAFGSLVIRGASIEWQAAQAKRALERYLPPELVDGAFSRGRGPDLSSRRQELTVVFVDVQGFSTLSETVDVEYIGRFLKGFFDGMSRAILKHQGRIHLFLGDGFLAVFGDLVPLDDHADAAVKAAMEMQREMTALNSQWANSGIVEFEKGINIRIGINTGMVFVGDLGSDKRLEYTVVGSAVNIASRLQALAPPGGIMMTSRTKALLKQNIRCQGPESVRLKGIDRETKTYTIPPDLMEASSEANQHDKGFN